MIVVHQKEGLEQAVKQFHQRVAFQWNGEKPIELLFDEYRSPMTRSQQGLYWRWMTDIARATGQNKDDIHDMLRYRFLGTEEVTVGTETFNRLPSTTRMTTLEMSEYMTKIEAWAYTLGIMLLIPEHTEYAKYREAAQ